MCSCCLASHIRLKPEAKTKDAAKASEAAAAEQQKQAAKTSGLGNDDKRPEEVTSQAMDLDGLSTAAATAAPPRATTHGPRRRHF